MEVRIRAKETEGMVKVWLKVYALILAKLEESLCAGLGVKSISFNKPLPLETKTVGGRP